MHLFVLHFFITLGDLVSRRKWRSSTPSNSSGGNDTTSSLKDNGSNECETELATAESCALDDDEDEEGEVLVTVPMKSFGLVNKIRSMTAYKVSFNLYLL
jgi:hypothetical protein